MLKREVPSAVGNNSFNADNKELINSHVTQKPIGVKLPTIELPKFDGNLSKWVTFRDSFKSLIHNNASIERIQKFHYLASTLSGSAKDAIRSIGLIIIQKRVKWKTPFPPIELGELVIIKDDNLPPSFWKLGRINELHTGKDNVT